MAQKSKVWQSTLLLTSSLLLVPVTLAVLMGALWGLVDWLRNYGTGASALPYFDHLLFQLETFKMHAAGTIIGCIKEGINFYNLTFCGATRFGSGIGFVAGAFIVMGMFKKERLALRITAGAIAGAMIGARSALMFGSGTLVFLVGMSAGFIAGATFMAVDGHLGKALPLPVKRLPSV